MTRPLVGGAAAASYRASCTMACGGAAWFCQTAVGGTDGRFADHHREGHVPLAAKVSLGGLSSWYGFKPIEHRATHGPGFVDNSDRASAERSWATWNIDDDVLIAAVSRAVAQYRTEWYCVGYRDCVSFTADQDAMASCVPAARLQPGKLKCLGVLTKAEEGWAVMGSCPAAAPADRNARKRPRRFLQE